MVKVLKWVNRRRYIIRCFCFESLKPGFKILVKRPLELTGPQGTVLLTCAEHDYVLRVTNFTRSLAGHRTLCGFLFELRRFGNKMIGITRAPL